MKEGLGLSQRAMSPLWVRRGSGKKRKNKLAGAGSCDRPQREPSGKGSVSPTQAGRTGDAAELQGHPRRRLRDYREPCPVGRLYGLDLGKPSACSMRGAADDCVRPPGRPSLSAAEHPCGHLAAAATRGALAQQLREERQDQRPTPCTLGVLGSGTSRQETC